MSMSNTFSTSIEAVKYLDKLGPGQISEKAYNNFLLSEKSPTWDHLELLDLKFNIENPETVKAYLDGNSVTAKEWVP